MRMVHLSGWNPILRCLGGTFFYLLKISQKIRILFQCCQKKRLYNAADLTVLFSGCGRGTLIEFVFKWVLPRNAPIQKNLKEQLDAMIHLCHDGDVFFFNRPACQLVWINAFFRCWSGSMRFFGADLDEYIFFCADLGQGAFDAALEDQCAWATCRVALRSCVA